jgi:hypothetical protein
VPLVEEKLLQLSAPGGLDSIDNDAVVGLDEKKSMFGVANEQAARLRPPATTVMARPVFMLVPCLMFRGGLMMLQSRAVQSIDSSSRTPSPRTDVRLPRPSADGTRIKH